MKHLTKELWFNTRTMREFINITPTVEELVRESGIQEGLLPRRCLSMMTKAGSTRTLISGWKNSRRMNRFRHTATTWARKTPTHT